ncbi:hypothetical protein PSPO01_14574 [Paraphaeosphaeria sporulosa]
MELSPLDRLRYARRPEYTQPSSRSNSSVYDSQSLVVQRASESEFAKGPMLRDFRNMLAALLVASLASLMWRNRYEGLVFAVGILALVRWWIAIEREEKGRRGRRGRRTRGRGVPGGRAD